MLHTECSIACEGIAKLRIKRAQLLQHFRFSFGLAWRLLQTESQILVLVGEIATHSEGGIRRDERNCGFGAP
jgi:hypothetical protein